MEHEFDSSWTCNYCGIAEERARRGEKCPVRLEQQAQAAGEALKPGVVPAVQNMMDLCRTIDSCGLTINDLADGCRLAIADGHDHAEICLSMMTIAVKESRKETASNAR